jgi:hypothetical protein
VTVQSFYRRWREEIEPRYRFKAEMIVRWFDDEKGLGMTTEEKIRFLQQEFAGLEMRFVPRQRPEK